MHIYPQYVDDCDDKETPLLKSVKNDVYTGGRMGWVGNSRHGDVMQDKRAADAQMRC